MTFTSHKSQISAPRVTNTLNKRGFAEKHIFQQTSFLFLSTQAGLLHFEAMLMWFPSGFVGCTTDLSSRSSARMLVKMALRNLFPNSYDFPFSSKLFLLVHVRKTEDTNGELSKMEGCVLERRENKRRKREEKQLNWEKVFDRMHDERRQLCCCFDLAVHYRVHLSLWFCDRNIVHEEKERTEEDYVENAKWNEKFPIECE